MTTVDFSVDEYPYNHDGQSLKSVVESYKLDDSEKQDVSEDRRLVLFGTDGWETVTLETLLCSTLLISESGFDGVFERFSSGFAVEFSSELERSEILCEAIF